MTDAKAVPSSETHDSLDISMAKLTLPAFGTAVLSVSHGLIDSFFLSKLSYTAAAAVGGVFSFLALCSFLLRNFAQAGGIVANQHLGARQPDKVAKTLSVSLTLGIILGLILSSGIFLLRNQVGHWLGFSDSLNQMTVQYLSLAFIIIFIQSISFSYLVFISIHGRTSWNFGLILVMNLLNISANTLLLYWQDGKYFGISTVALSTIMASLVATIMAMYLVHVTMRIPPIAWVGAAQFKLLARQIAKIGIPSSLFPVSLQLNLLALIYLINQLGPEMLSTQVYAINIIMLTISWTTAVAQSSQIYISRLVGSKGFAAAETKLKQNLAWGITGALTLTSLFCLFSDHIFGLMTDNKIILEQGGIILLMGLALEPLRAINMIVLASLNATGDAKYPGLLSILMMWVVGVPLSWFFGIHMGYGLVGIYMGRIIDEALRAVMVYRRWYTGIWETKGVTLEQTTKVALQRGM